MAATWLESEFTEPYHGVCHRLLDTVTYVLSRMIAPVLMYEASRRFVPLFYMAAAVGIVRICLLGDTFEGGRFLSWFGQASVVALVPYSRMIPSLRAVAAVCCFCSHVDDVFYETVDGPGAIYERVCSFYELLSDPGSAMGYAEIQGTDS